MTDDERLALFTFLRKTDTISAEWFDRFVSDVVPPEDTEGRARAALLKADAIRESELLNLSAFDSSVRH